MRTSEKTDQVMPAFALTLDAVRNVEQDAKNSFQGNKYATLNQLRKMIYPAARENGLIVVQSTAVPPDDGVLVITTVHHPASEQWLSTELYLPARGVTIIKSKKEPEKKPEVIITPGTAQGYGGAFTYACRYSLAGLFFLRMGDDDGYEVSNPPIEEGKAITPPWPNAPAQDVTEHAEGWGKTWDYAIRTGVMADWDTITRTALGADDIDVAELYPNPASVPTSKWPEVCKAIQKIKKGGK